jgi:hypothetical protein
LVGKGATVVFELEDCSAAGYPEQQLKCPIPTEINYQSLLSLERKRRLIALVSGMEVQSQFCVHYDILHQFLEGNVGGPELMQVS